MSSPSLQIVWRQTSEKDDYWYGETGTRFPSQIGKSANAGKYIWTIFHADFRYVVYGGEVASVKLGQEELQAWVESNAKTPQW